MAFFSLLGLKFKFRCTFESRREGRGGRRSCSVCGREPWVLSAASFSSAALMAFFLLLLGLLNSNQTQHPNSERGERGRRSVFVCVGRALASSAAFICRLDGVLPPPVVFKFKFRCTFEHQREG
jgi:hypothetical protein